MPRQLMLVEDTELHLDAPVVAETPAARYATLGRRRSRVSTVSPKVGDSNIA